MSNYTVKAKDKKTGEVVDVHCLDDFYGKHEYGYQVEGSNFVMDSKAFNNMFEIVTAEVPANQVAHERLSYALSMIEEMMMFGVTNEDLNKVHTAITVAVGHIPVSSTTDCPIS